jgi:site-specific DNA-methyltransferase (adenine-specific)
MNTAVHFSSATDMWETPQATFDELDREFDFNMDVCATAENAKTPYFMTKEMDGLAQPWNHLTCWMNPPYGKTIGNWVEKAATSNAKVVVALLPARTCTRWFHDWIYNKPNVEIRFLKGRLKFGGHKNSAPFPSMVVIFRPVDNSPLPTTKDV